MRIEQNEEEGEGRELIARDSSQIIIDKNRIARALGDPNMGPESVAEKKGQKSPTHERP